MADVAPTPVLPSWTPARPRRTPKPPRVSYRRSPGAVSRPVPRQPVPTAGGGSAVRSALGNFPWALALSLFFGGVLRNSDRASELQRADLDALAVRQLAKLARGTERRVRIAKPKRKPVAEPGRVSAVRPGVRPGAAADAGRVASPVLEPAPLPAPELEPVPVSDALRAPEPVQNPEIWGNPEQVRRGAPRPASPPLAPKFPISLPTFPNFFEDFRPRPELVESPLLTPFEAPGVRLSPLAEPYGFAEPLPEPEPDRCRCRARKPKKQKPGKGFFTVDSRGREKRRYWQNREQRENAGNAGRSLGRGGRDQ